MRRIVYDCEIIRCIPPKGVEVLVDNKENYFTRFGDGFEYCGGWNDFENMGISVIGAADIDTGELLAFIHPDRAYEMGIPIDLTIYDFGETAEDCTEIWGFNSANFDDKLCQANGMNIETDCDLLQLVRLAAYGSTDYRDQPRGYSYSLDAIAKANGYAKTGSGELAPKLWQQGKYQEVIDYCLNDVRITRELILLWMQGRLVDPNTNKFLGG